MVFSIYIKNIWTLTKSERVSFTKIKRNEEFVLYLSLKATGSTLNVSEKGVILLFTDGDKIEFPNAEIDTKAGDGAYWEYFAFVSISNEQLDKIITKDIDAFRLYIYDSNVTPYPNNIKRKTKQIRGWAQAIKEAI